MRFTLILPPIFALIVPTLAHAQSSGADDPPFMHVPASSTRRNGFTFGLSTGASVVTSNATPTAYAQRNDAYRVQIGPRIAPSFAPFIGFALSDELSFTLSIEPQRITSGDVHITGTAFQFRFEAFPFVWLGETYRDLGIAPRFGLGSSRFTQISTGDSIAASGTYSLVGVDFFWDALRSGSFALGPTVGFAYRFSDTMTESDVLLGLRVAYYARP